MFNWLYEHALQQGFDTVPEYLSVLFIHNITMDNRHIWISVIATLILFIIVWKRIYDNK